MAVTEIVTNMVRVQIRAFTSLAEEKQQSLARGLRGAR